MKLDDQAIYAWELVGILSIVWMLGSTLQLRTASSLIIDLPLYSLLIIILLLLIASYFMIWGVTRVLSEEIITKLWYLIDLVTTLCSPFNNLLSTIDTFAKRVALREEKEEEEISYLTEEIRTVVDEGEREGLLNQQARNMIHRVIELNKEDVSSVMTPRIDIVSIQADMTISEARKILMNVGHSRLPVYKSSPDDIIGILYAKDMLSIVEDHDLNRSVSEIVRTPLMIPESSGIHQLLETMKSKRVHIAIVYDEYGGVSGLVTMEDILEEIVGDIADEYDLVQDDRIKKISPTLLEVDARVHLDELNDLFDLEFPEEEDYDTIGGFIISVLGRIPRIGESVMHENSQLTVVDAGIRKVNTVKIRMPERTVIRT
jgi:CBS domain containing-hemolysin-like protein